MFVLLEDHDTDLFVALLGIMVVVSCFVLPAVKVAEEVFREMLVTLTLELGVTVILQIAVFPLPSEALQVIVAVPADLAVTSPELLTEAMLELFDDQVTDLFVALLGVIVATSCLVLPTVIETEDALRVMFVTFLSVLFSLIVILKS